MRDGKKLFERRWLINTVVGLGFISVLEGCALQDREIESMPNTEVSDLISNPDKYKGAVKTIGFVEPTSSRTEDDTGTSLVPEFNDDSTFKGFKLETYLVKRSIDEYALRGHEGSAEESFPLIIAKENRSTFLPPNAPILPKLRTGERYRFAGHIETVKDIDGKPKFAIRISAEVEQYRAPYQSNVETVPTLAQ